MGRFCEALVGFGMLWKVLGGCHLAASGRLCKALDALEGFGGFSYLWQVWKALERFWEALRGFGKVWEALM